MNVDELMTREVRTCRERDSLHQAARLMWETDCGCVPVVDDENRVVGMITDRDVAMAAYHQGASLPYLAVASAMAREVHVCRPGDAVEMAEASMRLHRIRRLPVVEDGGRIEGILSLNDVARGLARARGAASAADVGRTLAAIGERRHAGTDAGSSLSS